jgi:hypothetical protein
MSASGTASTVGVEVATTDPDFAGNALLVSSAGSAATLMDLVNTGTSTSVFKVGSASERHAAEH